MRKATEQVDISTFYTFAFALALSSLNSRLTDADAIDEGQEHSVPLKYIESTNFKLAQ